jgi:hypothetical protein
LQTRDSVLGCALHQQKAHPERCAFCCKEKPYQPQRERSERIAAGKCSSINFARSAAIPLKYDGAGVAVSTSASAQTEDVEGYVLQRLDVLDNGQGKKEEDNGQRR